MSSASKPPADEAATENKNPDKNEFLSSYLATPPEAPKIAFSFQTHSHVIVKEKGGASLGGGAGSVQPQPSDPFYGRWNLLCSWWRPWAKEEDSVRLVLHYKRSLCCEKTCSCCLHLDKSAWQLTAVWFWRDQRSHWTMCAREIFEVWGFYRSYLLWSWPLVARDGILSWRDPPKLIGILLILGWLTLACWYQQYQYINIIYS